MGGLSSKQWAEVSNDGTPGSPGADSSPPSTAENSPVATVALVAPSQHSATTPRSQELDDDEESSHQRSNGTSQLKDKLMSTPTGISRVIKNIKALSLDPRSPSSGVSRTPIIVQSESPSGSAAADNPDSASGGNSCRRRRLPKLGPKRGDAAKLKFFSGRDDDDDDGGDQGGEDKENGLLHCSPEFESDKSQTPLHLTSSPYCGPLITES